MTASTCNGQAPLTVGLTYDLRDDYLAAGFSEEETAEFDRLETIEALDEALRGLGCRTDRIGNVKALAPRLVRGERWDLVFNIAEGLRGFGREAQVPALLEAYGIPFTFSDSLLLALSLHKGLTKRVVRDMGHLTPDFFVLADLAELSQVDLPYPVFAKPVAEGTGKGIDASSKISSPQALKEACARLLRLHRQPVLIESFLPGREYTVGITGTGREAVALGALEVVVRDPRQDGVYSYENKERCEELVEYRLAGQEIAGRAHEMSLAIWRGLGCRDGGRIDLRMDGQGRLQFLEINPLAGLHPSHSDLPIICSLVGIPYQELIGRIMTSARRRIARKGSW